MYGCMCMCVVYEVVWSGMCMKMCTHVRCACTCVQEPPDGFLRHARAACGGSLTRHLGQRAR